MREITGGVPSYHLRCTKESQAEVFDTLETGGNAVNAVYKYAYTQIQLCVSCGGHSGRKNGILSSEEDFGPLTGVLH